MPVDSRKIELIKHAETYTVSWGVRYRGRTFDDCPNSYLRYIAENFDGYPQQVAEALLEWREENGVDI